MEFNDVILLSRIQANASSTWQISEGWESVLYMSRDGEIRTRHFLRHGRLGLAHRVVVAGGVLDGVVVGRDGADPGRERRPVQEEALVLLFDRERRSSLRSTWSRARSAFDPISGGADAE